MGSRMQQGKRGEVGVNDEAMELKKKKKSVNDGRYGDGVAWRRGAMLGKGSFGCVYMASLKKPRSKYGYFPSVMAVKSAEVSVSASIQKEREVLAQIKGNPYVIRCFGEETTTGENGEMVYNLLLEYGSAGTLADRIKKSGGEEKGLPELEVRFHTRSLLRGLNHIHLTGYVHCDLKPDNIFLVPSSGEVNKGIGLRAKIGDFGLTKREKQSKKRRLEPYWRGTPMYLSPEVVKDSVQESPSDVWALGCIVLEMLTGKPPWAEEGQLDVKQILSKIEQGQLPKIPTHLSKVAMEFLKGCFVKNDMYRLTAEMLLNHSFVQGLDEDEDWRFEEVEEVEDINVIDSIVLVSDFGDEFGAGGWSCVSEDEDSMYYWSDEDDVEGIEDYEDSSCYDEEERGLVGNENPGDLTPSTDTGFDISETSLEVSSEVPSHGRQTYPIDYTIRAGV
nr:mitogen-activated protein kinase kinase kinase 3-like [Ipomoea trifida]